MDSSGRLIAVGDIHGDLGKLKQLIAKLDPTSKDRLVFVGDYIDRGPDAKGVIDFLLELKKRTKCVFLRGNHEDMLIGVINNIPHALDLWMQSGGDTTVASYTVGDIFDIPNSHLEFVGRTKVLHVEDTFVFVHAGLCPDQTIEHQIYVKLDYTTAIWGREHIKRSLYKWKQSRFTVVCGHSPHRYPVVRNNLICIDTGSVFPGLGTLTAVVLDSSKPPEFVQVGRHVIPSNKEVTHATN